MCKNLGNFVGVFQEEKKILYMMKAIKDNTIKHLIYQYEKKS